MKTKSGNPIHPIGIGTWMIGGAFKADSGAKYKGAQPSSENEQGDIEGVRYSLSLGQNHLDCAELYGAFHTDEVIGKAIEGQKREDLFIADKLWKTSVGEGLVRPTVDTMLKKLGTSYLDMLYIHSPWADVDWKAAIPQIDDLINEGIVRHFGVSNFTVEQMQETARFAKHQITANQMEYNVLYKDEVDQAFLDYCATNSVEVVAYQPIKRQAVVHDLTIQSIAGAHDATPAQVALAWLLAKNTLPIPKAVQKAHIDENIAAINLRLTDEEIDTLDKL